MAENLGKYAQNPIYQILNMLNSEVKSLVQLTATPNHKQ